MATPSNIERRPGPSSGAVRISSGSTDFPREWGDPPASVALRREWIKSNIRDAEARVARGEPRPDWLAREHR